MKPIDLASLFHQAVAYHGSQVAVAKHCGLSQSMVSLYLSGRVRQIRVKNLLRIARCLRVRPTVLLRALEQSGSIVRP